MNEREWEQQMFDNGVERFRERNRKLEVRGREDETPYGLSTVRMAIEPLAKAIMDRSKEPRRPRRPPVASACFVSAFLRLMAKSKPGTVAQGADVLAYIVSKYTHQRLALEQPKLTDVAIRVGQAIEEEERRCRQAKDEVEIAPWPKDKDLHVGTELLDLYAKACGDIVIIKDKGQKWAEWTVSLSDSQRRYVTSFNEEHEDRKPQWLPMIEPPKLWNEQGQGGGYHFIPRSLVKPTPNGSAKVSPRMVEAVNVIQATPWRINTRVLDIMRRIMAEKTTKVGKIPAVLGKRKFNLKLATTKEEKRLAWREHRDRRKQKMKRDKAVFTINAAVACLAIQYAASPKLWFPHQLDWRGRFYAMPEHLNPQGPDYARALLMFDQGQPITTPSAERWLAIHGANCYGIKGDFKARQLWTVFAGDDILQSAADPIRHRWWIDAGDPWQFLAFCFEWADFKKQSYGFVSHLPIALDGTCNGLQHYAAMLLDEKSGEAVNLTPPPSTGSVSQATYFDDAIERQYVGTETVDDADGIPLLDANGARVEYKVTEWLSEDVAPPQDIYQRVADKVKARVLEGDYPSWFSDEYEPKRRKTIERMKSNKADEATKRLAVDTNTADADSAQLVALARAGKIDRNLTKSHVMTFVYGKTDYGRQATLREFLTDPTESKTDEPLWPRDLPNAVVSYLREHITREIKRAVPAATEAMAWLRDIAWLISRADKALTWRTPSGFEITQNYPNLKTRKVETRTAGGSIKRRLTRQTDDVVAANPMDRKKQVNSLPPNFIHSMDACALAETVLKSGQITSFAMIHDSYATTAAQTDDLARAVWRAFMRIYTRGTPKGSAEGSPPLEELRDRAVAELGSGKLKRRVKNPEPPPRTKVVDREQLPRMGSLDLTKLSHSRYLFS